MDIYRDNVVLVREFDEERDVEAVEMLERSCELGSNTGISFLTDMMGDPLCRIRFFPTRVMLVAEMINKNGELAGVIRGCIKLVKTSSGQAHVSMGCILGLRISPKRRRIGIGFKLVRALEAWGMRNGAEYMAAATEEHNLASTNLFVSKCNYAVVGRLTIIFHPIKLPSRPQRGPASADKIEKLSSEQALSLYRSRLAEHKEFFPVDIEAILQHKLNLGTWVCFSNQEQWSGLYDLVSDDQRLLSTTPSSWVVFSLWNTSEIYKLQARGAPLIRFLRAFTRIINGVLPAFFKPIPMIGDLPSEPFGFIFLHGLYSEGERSAELMKSIWRFACNLCSNTKGCNAIVTELGSSDPLREHVPRRWSTMSIPDLWCVKRLGDDGDDDDDRICSSSSKPYSTDFFVDPRDF